MNMFVVVIYTIDMSLLYIHSLAQISHFQKKEIALKTEIPPQCFHAVKGLNGVSFVDIHKTHVRVRGSVNPFVNRSHSDQML